MTLLFFLPILALCQCSVSTAWSYHPTRVPTSLSQATRTTHRLARALPSARRTTCLHDSMDDESTPDCLPLTDADMSRLAAMRSRHETIPIMILDAIVPGQRLEFGSADPKFQMLIAHVLEHGDEIGMIGLNPHTGRPLNMGVTLSIDKSNLRSDPSGNLVISVQGGRRFEVQGEPWMEDTDSFYFADVEITNNRFEPLSSEDAEQSKVLYEQIPSLVQDWLQIILEKEGGDSNSDNNNNSPMDATRADTSIKEKMTELMNDIGPMPQTLTDRAIWVAALVNPLPALGVSVCMEIRPAMLACKNDYDRLNLACAALQSSMDHMTGKKKHF